ncbi:MAG: HDIG domain-containing protein [Phycisphaerae bacterium]|nr:HDIG domain-containing protein [Phycisphaerae bacterium]
MAERWLDRWGRGGKGRGPSRTRRHAPSGALEQFREWLMQPGVLASGSVVVLLVLMCVAVIGLSRGRLLPAEGRIVDESRTARVEFEVIDAANTASRRAERAVVMPRVYNADESAYRELEASIRTLPVAAVTAQSFDEMAPEIRAAFNLTPDRFDTLRAIGGSESEMEAWGGRVARLMDLLADTPIVSQDELQLALADPAQRMELRLPAGAARNVRESAAISASADNSALLRTLVTDAGFVGSIGEAVAHRLAHGARPLFVFDKSETDARRAAAAAEVPPVMARYRVGEVLARRGQVLTAEQTFLLQQEDAQFRQSLPPAAWMARWAGVLGVALVITAVFAVYVRLFYRELGRTPMRFLGLAILMAGGAGAACWATIAQPGWLWGMSVAPVVFTAMIAVVAFEPRLGLAMAAAQCAVVGAALSLPLGYVAVILAASGLSAWQLRDVRSRNDVVRAALVVGAGLALSVVSVSLLSRPLLAQGTQLWGEIFSDALRAGLAGFGAGALTLVFLPTVERLFDVTTGMTLGEWRDPKQPLLRKLQLQAPGTFNHSHTVATLAEAAAEAVGANGLHVYVGALYHDIGKMNKPDYFVENQPRGFNRHSKLSPAMSLLVIVGHVKDGIELAREYRLPRSLVGYIETHHGTTLVEYFFDRARREAEEEDGDPGASAPPDEVEYRYPGPKPRTKEQAILMICDAVESATRSMPDPTPSRIQSLVNHLATKRLMDGQFDECNLTLAELHRIEEAVTRTLASIYHGRIAYPTAESDSRTAAASDSRGPAERAG